MENHQNRVREFTQEKAFGVKVQGNNKGTKLTQRCSASSHMDLP